MTAVLTTPKAVSASHSTERAGAGAAKGSVGASSATTTPFWQNEMAAGDRDAPNLWLTRQNSAYVRPDSKPATAPPKFRSPPLGSTNNATAMTMTTPTTSSAGRGNDRRWAASTTTVNRGNVANVSVATATPASCTAMKNASQCAASKNPLSPRTPQAETGRARRLAVYPPTTPSASAPNPARMATIQNGETSSLPYSAAVPNITAAMLIATTPWA